MARFAPLTHYHSLAIMKPSILGNTVAKTPGTFLERVRFLGPGIIFAACAVGSGELLLTPRSGALYGYTLLWVAVVTLVYKYAFTMGMSRFTVSRGHDIFYGLAEVPGPRHWATYFVFAVFVVETVGHGGIALLSGTAIYALFNDVNVRVAGTLSVLLAAVLLWRGSYSFMENIIKVMAAILIAGVAYNVFQTSLPLDRMVDGLVPRIPQTKDGLLTVMGLMGWIGSGMSTLLYSSWLIEKMGSTGQEESVYRQWMKTVKLDVAVSYILIGAISFGFLVLGVQVLGGQEVGFKGGRETMMVLSAMLEKTPYGKQVFLVTAYFTLFSTLVSGMDGRGRAFASMLRAAKSKEISEKHVYRGTIIFYAITTAVVCWTGRPVKVVLVISACAAVGFAILGFIMVYLDAHLSREARGGPLWYSIVLLGSSLFLGIALYKSHSVIVGLLG